MAANEDLSNCQMCRGVEQIPESTKAYQKTNVQLSRELALAEDKIKVLRFQLKSGELESLKAQLVEYQVQYAVEHKRRVELETTLKCKGLLACESCGTSRDYKCLPCARCYPVKPLSEISERFDRCQCCGQKITKYGCGC